MTRNGLLSALALVEWKQFGMPGGIYIDGRDTVYVADTLSGADVHPG